MHDEHHDNHSPRQTESFPPARWVVVVAIVVAAALAGWLARDWSDPCRGQITDLLGCFAAQVEIDQAEYEAEQAELAEYWASIPAEWRQWCQQVEPLRTASPWGDLPNRDDEAAFQHWCVP